MNTPRQVQKMAPKWADTELTRNTHTENFQLAPEALLHSMIYDSTDKDKRLAITALTLLTQSHRNQELMRLLTEAIDVSISAPTSNLKQQVDSILQSVFAEDEYWNSGEQGKPTELKEHPDW
eukprot:TRINITY_DN14853_c0_g1_i1.p1 TRINITY_DN14853_c0_g1~~TRINITY_DN14853_c0_g1_i1.p1  ORF type:complete len:122 (-),score=16.46 TRINITY_DN14853_c0_g1_i1:139-504(-)